MVSIFGQWAVNDVWKRSGMEGENPSPFDSGKVANRGPTRQMM